MGYYMRYIVTDDRPLSIGDLDSALKSVDEKFAIVDGDLCHAAEVYGEIEVDLRGEELCDEELAELEAFAEDSDGANKQCVIDMLRDAKAIVAVRVLWQGREPPETLEKLDPLWKWLLANRQGLLQADEEGYYDETGLILEAG